MFDFHRHTHNHCGDDPPKWAVKMQADIMAALKGLSGKLSPEDQAKLNAIYDNAKADAAKIDTALK